MSVRAYELPLMDEDTAELLGLIAARLKQGEFAFGGGSWRFRLTPLTGRLSWPSDPFVVSMEWGGGRLHLLTSRASVSLLYAHRFPEAPLDVLPQHLALAGFRLAWAELMARLEQMGGRRVRLLSAARATTGALDGVPYRFRLSLDSGPARDGFRGVLAVDENGLPLLGVLARRQPPGAPAADPDTPISLRLELGEMKISVSGLRALSVHDVLLPDTIIDAGEPVLWLRADKRHAARARFNGLSLTIESILKKTTATSMPSESERDEAAALAPVEEIEIRLSFDLGEKTVRLAELAALQVGQVLQLDGPASRLVAVRANGRLVGRGELVRVADQVGVRVLELARPGEEAPPMLVSQGLEEKAK